MVPMVSLLQRFHCTGQLTVIPMVSLLQRFHCSCYGYGSVCVVCIRTYVTLLSRYTDRASLYVLYLFVAFPVEG